MKIEETMVIPISLQPTISNSGGVYKIEPTFYSLTPKEEAEREGRIKESVNLHLNQDADFNDFLEEMF